MTKAFIAIMTFLNSTQIVYELLKASGKIQEIQYSSNTYYASAWLLFILTIWGMFELAREQ